VHEKQESPTRFAVVPSITDAGSRVVLGEVEVDGSQHVAVVSTQTLATVTHVIHTCSTMAIHAFIQNAHDDTYLNSPYPTMMSIKLHNKNQLQNIFLN